MRNLPFANSGYYHVMNRGVDKRTIFGGTKDYQRFLNGMIAFNDVDRCSPISLSKLEITASQNPYVHVLAYCLMPNHFHLLLKQVSDRGVSEYLRRIGIGYTTYFNKKYERTGCLFQGPFKAISVETDSYLTHLSRYIHLNPLELVDPSWKTNGVIDWEAAHRYLEKYKWSSARYYLKENYPDFLHPEDILGSFKGKRDYASFLKNWATKTPETFVQDSVLEGMKTNRPKKNVRNPILSKWKPAQGVEPKAGRDDGTPDENSSDTTVSPVRIAPAGKEGERGCNPQTSEGVFLQNTRLASKRQGDGAEKRKLFGSLLPNSASAYGPNPS